MRHQNFTNKYRNVKYNGFASKKEWKRYQDLLLLEQAKKIFGLRCQVAFPITVGETEICKYIADFTYVDGETQDAIIEDCKGFRTPVYKLKKKLVEVAYPQYKFVES